MTYASKTYKELLHINKRTDNPAETRAKAINRRLTEKEIQTRNKYTTVYSTLLMTEGYKARQQGDASLYPFH